MEPPLTVAELIQLLSTCAADALVYSIDVEEGEIPVADVDTDGFKVTLRRP